MPLTPGTRLGPYEILSAIGAGGMGEVYKARDTRLDRTVAIKILPEAFAADADRVARFQREAKTLAALNHPNIAQIFGLDQAGDVHALAMEFVAGEDLSERIARGPVPIDEALPIAKQVAEALEAAHEQGIIHRDLKPANIKVRPDGTVKVLDFGLAKALEATGAVSASISMSPTITTPAMTQAGIILGTAAYMSPEQARGKPVDRRTDIWAFGAVLFEMLTGRRAFEAEDVSLTLAEVMKSEPDWNALPNGIPARLLELLRRCLKKDAKARLRDIGDARVQIEELSSGVREDVEPVITAGAPPRWRQALPWTLTTLIGGVAVLLVVSRPQPVPAGRPSRFVIPTSPDAPFRTGTQPAVTISPDGSRVVYRSARDADPIVTGLLYVRALDQFEAAPLRGSDGALSAVFSRDGKWIVYHDVRDGALKRVSALGGSPETICSLDGATLRGASWAPGDAIVFATDRSKGLLRVPAAGGKPERLTTVDPAKGERDHFWPDVMPDGRAVLFTSWDGSLDRSRIAVVSLPSGEVHRLLDGTSPRFSPTGHLLFAAADRTLRAVGFDVRRLQVIGSPVTVAEHVGIERTSGADFAVADDGSLVYTTETTVATTPRTLVWVDRAGHEDPINVPVRGYTSARLSPDGTRVALDVREGQNGIWIFDLTRQTLQQLAGMNRAPVWSPDGKRVAFTVERDGVPSVYWQAFDGSGIMERLSSGTQVQIPLSFSPDGAQLIFATSPSPPYDLGVITLGAPRTATMLLHSKASETNGVISTDGHWLAYESDESGRSEIYVRPFPNVETKRIQVSAGGGTRPLWSPTGRELFYYIAPDTIMAVSVRLGANITLGNSQQVVKHPYASAAVTGRHYDVSADGQRFLLLKDAPTPNGQKTAAPEIRLLLNWTEELKRLVPTK